VKTQPTIAVFDVGNVLIEWNPRNLYRRIFADPERMEWFLSNVCTSDWNLDLDRGRVIAEAVAERIALFPDHAAEIRAFDERWMEMVPGAIPGSLTLLERLRARGAPLYAITNFSREKFDVASRRFEFLNRFDGVIVSGDEKLVKPDPAIFRLFLSRYGFRGADCLFIDDSAANVEAARAIGMAAHHFDGPAALEARLIAHGLL
jgi:2-haloacid dehalogenase